MLNLETNKMIANVLGTHEGGMEDIAPIPRNRRRTLNEQIVKSGLTKHAWL